jgi:hypothetical protein
MKHNTKIRKFIKKHGHLFWYTPESKKQEVSDEFILEQVLNYAELSTIKEYFGIIGIEKAIQDFHNIKCRRKGNIYPEIYHLFEEYFKRNAQRNS